MAGGGPRWLSLIRQAFALLSQCWSLLNEIAAKLSRIERAVEVAGPKGINPDVPMKDSNAIGSLVRTPAVGA